MIDIQQSSDLLPLHKKVPLLLYVTEKVKRDVGL